MERRGKPGKQERARDPTDVVPGDIAGRAEEHGMAEGEQPGVADQQVEGAGEQGEAEDLHHQHRVDHGRRRHKS